MSRKEGVVLVAWSVLLGVVFVTCGVKWFMLRVLCLMWLVAFNSLYKKGVYSSISHYVIDFFDLALNNFFQPFTIQVGFSLIQQLLLLQRKYKLFCHGSYCLDSLRTRIF